MPALFSTFDEAWQHFGGVDEMDSFADRYPEREMHMLSWYIPVPAGAVPGVIGLQEKVTRLDGLAPIPPGRLHVSVAPAARMGEPDPEQEERLLALGRDAWRDERRFGIELRGVNVFPTAVVVEVRGDGPARLLDRLLASGYWQGLPAPAPNPSIFLPHLTVAIATRRRPAGDVRALVAGYRDRRFGTVEVAEVLLCRIPVARSRLLEPWTIVGRVGLPA